MTKIVFKRYSILFKKYSSKLKGKQSNQIGSIMYVLPLERSFRQENNFSMESIIQVGVDAVFDVSFSGSLDLRKAYVRLLLVSLWSENQLFVALIAGLMPTGVTFSAPLVLPAPAVTAQPLDFEQFVTRKHHHNTFLLLVCCNFLVWEICKVRWQ